MKEVGRATRAVARIELIRNYELKKGLVNEDGTSTRWRSHPDHSTLPRTKPGSISLETYALPLTRWRQDCVWKTGCIITWYGLEMEQERDRCPRVSTAT